METAFYENLTRTAMAGEYLEEDICRKILHSQEIELLPLLNSAFQVREKYFGRGVKIHILNNVQNGLCKEDCQYCAQSKNSHAAIEIYPMKSDEEIMEEARMAYENGAFRYCMVFSGRGISDQRVDHICRLVKEIKQRYHIEVCVSPGTVTQAQAKTLKAAGLDRLNHNINTSENMYEKICSTHTFNDRLNTLNAAKNADLQICSGVIVGMGETPTDIINMAKKLHELKVESLPVNFFMPIEGLPLTKQIDFSPEYCLRILCLFRFLNPETEIRVAAGRELYFRDMQVLAFYPANSLFMEGYLNTRGENRLRTLQMLKDANFTIESDKELQELIDKETAASTQSTVTPAFKFQLKDKNDLHLQIKSS